MSIPNECLNCGMLNQPLTKAGYCDGCVCANCKRDAGECGCSMNDMGWCDDCEEKLQSGYVLTSHV